MQATDMDKITRLELIIAGLLDEVIELKEEIKDLSEWKKQWDSRVPSLQPDYAKRSVHPNYIGNPYAWNASSDTWYTSRNPFPSQLTGNYNHPANQRAAVQAQLIQQLVDKQQRAIDQANTAASANMLGGLSGNSSNQPQVNHGPEKKKKFWQKAGGK